MSVVLCLQGDSFHLLEVFLRSTGFKALRYTLQAECRNIKGNFIHFESFVSSEAYFGLGWCV